MSLPERLRGLLDLGRLSDRDRRALILGLVVLGPAVVYLAGVRPYLRALDGMRDQVASERALLERERALIASAPVLPEIVMEAQTRSAQTTTRLLRSSNRVLAEGELTDYLEQVAGVSRVLLQQVRAVTDTTWTGSPELQPIRVAIRGESDLQGVATYMHRLESSPLLLRVTELAINPIAPTPTPTGGRGGNNDDEDPPVPQQQADVIQFSALVEAFVSTRREPAAPMEQE